MFRRARLATVQNLHSPIITTKTKKFVSKRERPNGRNSHSGAIAPDEAAFAASAPTSFKKLNQINKELAFGKAKKLVGGFAPSTPQPPSNLKEQLPLCLCRMLRLSHNLRFLRQGTLTLFALDGRLIMRTALRRHGLGELKPTS